MLVQAFWIMENLWIENTPARFWLCQPDLSDRQWEEACQKALPVLGLPVQPQDSKTMTELVLGEAQFGPCHWQLSPLKRLYYQLKPILPRCLTCFLRRLYKAPAEIRFPLNWPIETRYARFQWEIMRQLLLLSQKQAFTFSYFWPEGHRFAFVLTHDVETSKGLANIQPVAALEESLGFRSSFNFVPDRYPLNAELRQELVERGFEIGVHGLKHDGKLFKSQESFNKRAIQINHYLETWEAVGFRAPLTHRNPAWMQRLHIDYDLSFFDTDPYEPLPGGAMSIWPYIIGRFVELPYTLPQDATLTTVLGEKTPRIWLQKVDFIEAYHGMVLLNTHPDYLTDKTNWEVYKAFLQAMKKRRGYWHALPKEVARWWRKRCQYTQKQGLPDIAQGVVHLESKAIISVSA